MAGAAAARLDHAASDGHRDGRLHRDALRAGVGGSRPGAGRGRTRGRRDRGRGGVGGIAVALLARLGHNVTAISGRAAIHDYLRDLGARQVVGRDALPVGKARPLESERWGGAVDTVGGDLLAALLPTMAYNTTVACCGNAGGIELRTTVFPFILRAVALVGVESVLCPAERRRHAWSRLARDLPLDALDRMTQTVPLADAPRLSAEILAGRVRGRVVVDVNRC